MVLYAMLWVGGLGATTSLALAALERRAIPWARR
jgi:ABC-type nitrate/sulfonate/bicarbonate transport system permease component